jgi:phosphomannomutase
MFDADADALGLEVDHDDSHCFGDKPFALLAHGTQPKGSALGAAIRQRRAQGLHAGYNKKNKVAA